MKKLFIWSGIISLIFPLLFFFLIIGGSGEQPTPVNPNPNLTEEQLNFISQIISGAKNPMKKQEYFHQ
ncbi:hypothetical protein ACJ2U2_15835 (plasmid) [Clostridium perfringens]|uniref:hypothetical protein n=1 Tax=Clostridium perfringens TaxID=1502 RepID=UPI0038CF32D4